jgi:RNA polymerase sigma factor (sigma-70 family)
MEHLLGASSGQRSSGLGVVAAAGLTGKTRAGGDTNLDMEVSMSAALAVRLPDVDPVMDPESRAWVAVQAADDAVMGVLARLADFRGLSRFTTWAYKFALLEAATRARRMAWRDRELPRPPEDWLALAAPDGHPEAAAEHAELLAAVRTAVAEVLTPHQREVLLTVVAGRVPLDVLAERRGTTRGALYKTIHDARRKLRHHLAANGLLAGEEVTRR